MDKKYIEFYKTFHKKFKNDENLILCSKTFSDRRVSLNRELKGVDDGIELNHNLPTMCI